jgi:hypothetical protein
MKRKKGTSLFQPETVYRTDVREIGGERRPAKGTSPTA